MLLRISCDLSHERDRGHVTVTLGSLDVPYFTHFENHEEHAIVFKETRKRQEGHNCLQLSLSNSLSLSRCLSLSLSLSLSLAGCGRSGGKLTCADVC